MKAGARAPLSAPRARRLRERLLAWYDASRRDLPWRRTRDPYAIWISETMLQQTRVEAVIPYYHRFLERFPSVEVLADADEQDVYAHWAGLGYYSRARNLHRAARAVVDDHGGELPSEAGLLRELPGIGRYTAGAVASIAFDRPEPVVDGNVVRVLARLLGIRDDVTQPGVEATLWSAAASLALGSRPGDLNQAMMELGATVCTPRSPRCEGCPLRRSCDAQRKGDAEALPRKPAKARVRRVRATAALVERSGRVLVVRRESGGLLGGLWELPGGELSAREKPEEGLRRALGDGLGLKLRGVGAVGRVKHGFTHRDLTLHVFRCEADAGRVRRKGFTEHRWLRERDLVELPCATVTRKAIDALRTPMTL